MSNLVNATPPTVLGKSILNIAGVFKGLRMCMRYYCNPHINFCYFFRSLNFVIFWLNFYHIPVDTGCLVDATPPTILPGSFLNFAGVFVKV